MSEQESIELPEPNTTEQKEVENELAEGELEGMDGDGNIDQFDEPTDEQLLEDNADPEEEQLDEQGRELQEDKGDENQEGLEKSGLDDEHTEEGADGMNDEEMKDETGKDEDEEEEEEEEEEESSGQRPKMDLNVMPQVNVQVLASRRWQVKVYPLKPAEFMSGNIWRVFKDAKESLLYLISAGKYSRGKGEMYISSVNMTLRVVQGLMKRDSSFNEINVEIVKKNDEGVVEEKAYMRFDTKMVRMLFVPPSRSFSWGLHGRKRERLIGSVFVKNLPPSTSKDMLRVMFPFAQEINYNPEKFKEGTARLVLKARNSVIPCLKAFAKVELGGQVLELHPLEKKRTNNRSDSKGDSRHRSRSASVNSDAEEDEIKKEVEDKEEKDGDQEEAAASGDEKDTPKKSDAPKGKSESGDNKDKRKSEGAKGKDSARKDGDKSGRDRKDSDRPRRPNQRNESRGGHSQRGRQGDDFRNRRFEGGRGGGFSPRGARSGRGGGPRSYGERGYSSGGAKDSNVEATKDMLVLQNQLSMAIKSQLAVLNQTKMAVEQAKMGASGLGLGAGSSGMMSPLGDMDRGYRSRGSRGAGRDRSSGGYSGQKRKAGQAGLRQNDRGFNKRAQRGGGRGGASRAADYDDYSLREAEYRRELYARADEQRAADAYGLGSSYGSAYRDYYGAYGGY